MATTSITVNVAESQNYLATSKTISVSSQTKSQGYITLSTNSVTISGTSGTTQAVTITSNSGGTLSATSSDTSKVTASLSGTTITLTGVASGNATITVKVGETSSYTSATATISVTANIVQSISGINISVNGSYEFPPPAPTIFKEGNQDCCYVYAYEAQDYKAERTYRLVPNPQTYSGGNCTWTMNTSSNGFDLIELGEWGSTHNAALLSARMSQSGYNQYYNDYAIITLSVANQGSTSLKVIWRSYS